MTALVYLEKNYNLLHYSNELTDLVVYYTANITDDGSDRFLCSHWFKQYHKTLCAFLLCDTEAGVFAMKQIQSQAPA